MNQLLFYVLQVIAASGLIYACYHFALRNKKFHRYNRFYLLAAIIISIIIPFLNIPIYFSESQTGSSVVLQTLQVISSPAQPDDDDKIFEKGGKQAWSDFITKNINSTVPVHKGARAGSYTVIIQFIVDKEGSHCNFTTLTAHGYGMEEEALRVVKMSGQWNPGMQKGIL